MSQTIVTKKMKEQYPDVVSSKCSFSAVKFLILYINSVMIYIYLQRGCWVSHVYDKNVNIFISKIIGISLLTNEMLFPKRLRKCSKHNNNWTHENTTIEVY